MTPGTSATANGRPNPAILHDPDIRFALLRPVRALRYGAGTIAARAARPGPAYRLPPGRRVCGPAPAAQRGHWIAGLALLTAFPPHGFWILVVVTASAVNSVFAVIQEVKLVLWLCRRNLTAQVRRAGRAGHGVPGSR